VEVGHVQRQCTHCSRRSRTLLEDYLEGEGSRPNASLGHVHTRFYKPFAWRC